MNKVFAYITRGDELLVFSHPDYPEAGIQVPAGTVEAGESLEEAVLREACEETGLSGLRLNSYLGDQVRDMHDYGIDRIHHRHFYHLSYSGETTETWRHFENSPSGGSPDPIVFEFFWTRPIYDGEALLLIKSMDEPGSHLPIQLICDHGKLLPVLVERMGFSRTENSDKT